MFSTIIRRVLQIYDIKMGLTKFQQHFYLYFMCIISPHTQFSDFSGYLYYPTSFSRIKLCTFNDRFTEIIDMRMSLFIHNLLTLQKNFNTLQNWHENAKNSLYLKGLRL